MRTRLALAALLALGACKQAPKADAAGNTMAAPASGNTAKPVVAPPKVEEDLGEVPLGKLTGVWRVTGVMPGPAAKFARDDKQIMGSLMDVFPEQISWSYKASPAFAGSDICLGPVSAVIAERPFAEKARKLLTPAVQRLKSLAGRVSRPHQWLCGDGGSWGDDAEFQPLGDGRMAMRWPGDLTLLLERIKRPAASPAPLPPTGGFPGE